MDPLASLSPLSPPNMTVIENEKKQGAKATGSKKELLRLYAIYKDVPELTEFRSEEENDLTEKRCGSFEN